MSPAPPDAPVAPAAARRGLRLPLRTAFILAVAAVNLLVFAVGLAWARRVEADLREQQVEAYGELLGALVGTLVDGEGNLRSAGFLRWERWGEVFRDVHVTHFPDLLVPGKPSLGVELDPLGTLGRPATVDDAELRRVLRRAAEDDTTLEVAGGAAVPVRLRDGRRWGGCWIVPRVMVRPGAMARELLPWFLVSTLVLTLSTFTLVRSMVLDPVRRLSDAAGRIAAGDLSVRVPGAPRRDEIGDLVDAFNRMAEQVQGFHRVLAHEVQEATRAAQEAEAAVVTQRRLAATGELAAGVAHEINNPLGGLMNAIETLERGELPAERRAQYFGLVRGGLERIRGTVGRLLRLAPREASTERLALAAPLADALGLVRHRADRQGVRLVVDVDGRERDAFDPDLSAAAAHLPAVRGQANELGQAFLNLFVNALDALEGAGGPGCVRVTLRREGAELVTAVQDDGPGAPPEVLERAANAFFTTKEQGRGTGLGLSIVHHVVAGHGGRVLLSSPPGEGFRVELRLPVDADDGGGAEGHGAARPPRGLPGVLP